MQIVPDEQAGKRVAPATVLNDRKHRHRVRGITVAAFFALLLLIALAGLPRYHTWKKVRQVRAAFGEIYRALAWYGVDIAGWVPPDTRFRRAATSRSEVPLTFECEVNYAGKYLADSASSSSLAFWNSLTSPVQYLQPGHLHDPFHKPELYGYTCWTPEPGKVLPIAVVFSPGPDGIVQYPLERLRADMEPQVLADMKSNTFPDPQKYLPLVTPSLYDPTNGLTSPGDMIMIATWAHGCAGSYEARGAFDFDGDRVTRTSNR